MNLNKIDTRTMAEKFDKDGNAFICMNPLWKPPLIPLHPLDNNYRVIAKKQYNIDLLKKDLHIAIGNVDKWANKNKNMSWQSITLKSSDGGDQSFLKQPWFYYQHHIEN